MVPQRAFVAAMAIAMFLIAPSPSRAEFGARRSAPLSSDEQGQPPVDGSIMPFERHLGTSPWIACMKKHANYTDSKVFVEINPKRLEVVVGSGFYPISYS